MAHDYDIIILGAGTTAFAEARIAAMAGKEVAMIEKSHPGGTCINWGCIPSKTLIHKAEMYQTFMLHLLWLEFYDRYAHTWNIHHDADRLAGDASGSGIMLTCRFA